MPDELTCQADEVGFQFEPELWEHWTIRWPQRMKQALKLRLTRYPGHILLRVGLQTTTLTVDALLADVDATTK